MSQERHLPKGLNAVLLNLRLDQEVTPEIIHEFTEGLLALAKEKRLAREVQDQESRVAVPKVTVD